MKKIFSLLILIFLLITNLNIKTKAIEKNIDPVLLHDTIVTTLNPYIKEEIIKYYGYLKQYESYSIKIKNITRKDNLHYIVEVVVNTFVHAHNPPYGKETISFEITSSKISALSFVHEKDKYEILIDNFYNEIINEITGEFKLDLTTYTKYSDNQIFYLASRVDQFKTLEDILLDIVKNVQGYHTKSLYKNIIAPLTYLKNYEGYMIFKLTNGTNVIYKLKMKEDKWIVIDKLSKPGKEMEYVLYWYM